MPSKAIETAPATTPTDSPPWAFAYLRFRFAIWCAVVAAILLGHLIWFFLLRGKSILNNDVVLMSGQIVLGCLVLAIAWLLKTTPLDAIKLSRRRSEHIVIAGTALLHLAALVLLLPALSEDLVRYRLDGRMWLNGQSPYAVRSVEFSGETDSIDRLVTYPDMHTIYPPTSQLVFTIARALETFLPPVPNASGATWREQLPNQPWWSRGLVLRSIFALCAVGATFVLLRMLRHVNQSPWWAVLLAWNPLVVLETAGMGHQDMFGALLLLLALRNAQLDRPGWAGACLALASGVKPFAVILLPFIWREQRRDGLSMLSGFGLVVVTILLPPLLYQKGYQGWLTTCAICSTNWEANGSIYELFKWFAGDAEGRRAMHIAKVSAQLCGSLALVAAALILWRRRATAVQAGYWLVLTTLLVSPMVYPWYLIWLLAFVPLLAAREGWTALIWSATVGLSYVLWRQPAWVVPTAFALGEYLPVYLAVGMEIVRCRRKC